MGDGPGKDGRRTGEGRGKDGRRSEKKDGGRTEEG